MVIFIRKILLLGIGKSNKSILNHLTKYNLYYDIFDDSEENNKTINILDYDFLIKSNGVNNNHKLIICAKENNIKVISDLEYFYLINKTDDYVLCTGSNGKTSIVSLLQSCLKDSVSIGNNGLPFFDYIEDDKYKIIEASSYMLEYTYKTKYKYNIITNLFNTHLEHHGTFVNYIKSKLSFLKRLKKDDIVVYNDDDYILSRIMDTYEVKKVKVSINKLTDIYYLNDYIYCFDKKKINTKKLNLIGIHNIYNIMLVLGVVYNHPLKKEKYVEEIYNFNGVKYRNELIYDNECKIYNDSKSTNYKALSCALSCFENNVILICGGKHRNDDIFILDKHLYKIFKVYCYGENRYIFYNYFNGKNINCFVYETIEEVIMNLTEFVNKIILFSPGSVSFDQFKNFEHRGEVFNDLVEIFFDIKKLS